ncbi:MAG: hypothetical protein WC364_13060 [Eubacteriales bacterium]|jgi:hypothetical protein
MKIRQENKHGPQSPGPREDNINYNIPGYMLEDGYDQPTEDTGTSNDDIIEGEWVGDSVPEW